MIDNIEETWNTFTKLCGHISDQGLNDLIEELGERIILCPASTKEDQYSAYPGGLVEHALEVTAVMRTLNDALGFNLPIASVLKVGLLHEIGKVGDLKVSQFIDQDSDWHREKLGQVYKYNEDLQRMSVSHQTLYLLQHFGVNLTKDEWISIQLSQGSHFEENRFYVGHENSLSLLLQHAKKIVIHKSRP
mgnify:CR=1 FL=1